MSPQEGDSPQLKGGPSIKKKKRIIGTFPCPNCPKTFTRADHLSRHFLNHKPKQVFVCKYSITDQTGLIRNCGKTFVRRDLRERHYRRHLSEKSDTLSNKLAEPLSQSTNDTQQDYIKVEGVNGIENHHENLLISNTRTEGSTPSIHESAHSQEGNLLIQNHQEIHKPHRYGLQLPLPSLSLGIHNVAQSSPLNVPLKLSQNLSHDLSRNFALPSIAQSSIANHIPNASNIPSSTTPQFDRTDARTPNSQFQSTTPLNSFQHQALRHANFPSSQGDIISWLFTDNGSTDTFGQQFDSSSAPISNLYPNTNYGNEFNTSTDSGVLFPTAETRTAKGDESVSVVSTNHTSQVPHIQSQSIHNHTNNQNFSSLISQASVPSIKEAVDSDYTWNSFYYPAPKDQLYNNGLQDLNVFFNNDNPLESLLNAPQNDPAIGTLGLLPSTVSSTSPSQSNDSFTPKSVSDVLGHNLSMDLFESNKKSFSTSINRSENKQVYVSNLILNRLLQQLPSHGQAQICAIYPDVDNSRLKDRFCFFLQCYWEVFQPKFSILHRPSFSTETTEPLLLLAMICVGSMYSASSSQYSIQEKLCPEFKFCMAIVGPLRFTLFQHEQFKSPVRVWILQTLNLLEWCEKNYLLREMHERAHIHHGTTVQLLRRSPFLGGNPAVTNKFANNASDTATSGGEDENSDVPSDLEDRMRSDQSLFQKWVDSESMKRVTFMTFYLDIIDYIKFRHNPQIPFFQLQLLNLPCDEEQLWNNDEVNGSFQKVVKRQKKLHRASNYLGGGGKELNRVRPGMNFLSAMKRILRPQRGKLTFARTSTFMKNILIGGLSSLMHQMQLSEFQNIFTIIVGPTEKQKTSIWKEVLMNALDECETELLCSSLTQSPDSIFPMQLVRCKFPMFHMLQIIGLSDINHYDIAIYGGSPRNMSVDATTKDQQIIERKLHSIWSSGHWMKSSNDVANARSVVHCYWLLWKLMLAPMSENGEEDTGTWAYEWQVDYDFFDSMYAASVALLVLWCYTFATCGPESRKFIEYAESWPLQDLRDYNKMQSLCEENGFQYLARLRREFVALTRTYGSDSVYVLHQKSSTRDVCLKDVMKIYCEKLPFLTNKENISGLCFLVGTTLLKSQWEVIRENAKLIINCGMRSIGKLSVHCTDLFDNEFKD